MSLQHFPWLPPPSVIPRIFFSLFLLPAYHIHYEHLAEWLLSNWAIEQLSNEQEVHTHTYNEKTNNCINIAIQRVVLLSRTHNFHTYKAVIFRIVRSAFLWNNTITHNHLISSWKLYWNFSLVIHSFALSLSSLLRPPRQAFFFLNSFFELSKSMEYENVKKKYQIIWC